MGIEDRRGALVADLLARLWRSDWSIMEQFSEDAVLEDPLLPEPCHGSEAVLATFKFCHTWADLDPELRVAFSSGSLAAAEFVVRGTVTAPLEGYPPEVVGAPFAFGEVDVFEFDGDGLISRMSIYADVVGFDKQIREHAARESGGVEAGRSR